MTDGQWICFRQGVPRHVRDWAEKRQGSRLLSVCGHRDEPGVWHLDFEDGEGLTLDFNKLSTAT